VEISESVTYPVKLRRAVYKDLQAIAREQDCSVAYLIRSTLKDLTARRETQQPQIETAQLSEETT
jgi:predicted DNA-binding ribbon-helix-helix protein